VAERDTSLLLLLLRRQCGGTASSSMAPSTTALAHERVLHGTSVLQQCRVGCATRGNVGLQHCLRLVQQRQQPLTVCVRARRGRLASCLRLADGIRRRRQLVRGAERPTRPLLLLLRVRQRCFGSFSRRQASGNAAAALLLLTLLLLTPCGRLRLRVHWLQLP
jgi:hypothetical protein